MSTAAWFALGLVVGFAVGYGACLYFSLSASQPTPDDCITEADLQPFIDEAQAQVDQLKDTLKGT